jgi:predicted ArsR family transcriptional regulator
MSHRRQDLPASAAVEDLRQFLFDHVTSYDELALLLLAQRQPDVYWSAATAAESLGLSTEACRMALESLAAHGLLVGHSSRAGFRYAPNSKTLATNADHLRRAYSDDRFAIVQMMTANAMVRVRGAAARNFGEALQQRGHKR